MANLPVSNTFNFVNTASFKELMEKAYLHCGIKLSELTQIHQNTAIFSANLILSSWANGGLNLFTKLRAMQQLVPGQAGYILPQNTIDILGLTLVSLNRLTGGVGFSTAGTGGIPAGAFVAGGAAFTQTTSNGNLGYQFNVPSSVYYVGVQSNANDALSEYTLTLQYSYDGTNYYNLASNPKTLYPKGQIIWFVVPAPVLATYFRIVETGGATLNIQQLYFSIETNCQASSPISMQEQLNNTRKAQIQTPTSYYFDRQVFPTLTFYYTPNALWNAFVYNYSHNIDDVTYLTQRVNIPQRFYYAFIWALAADLAVQFAPEMFERNYMVAQNTWNAASKEDIQSNVPFRITPQLGSR